MALDCYVIIIEKDFVIERKQALTSTSWRCCISSDTSSLILTLSLHSSSVVRNQGSLAPRTLAKAGDILTITTRDGVWELLLASGGQTPGMLLRVLQCTGQWPEGKNYLVQNVDKAKVRRFRNAAVLSA